MAYSKKTWATEEEITSTGLNQMSDNIELGLRGLVADRQYAIVQKTIDLDGTTNGFTETITFSSDCEDGDPNFAVAPFVVGMSFNFVDSLTDSRNIALRVTGLSASGMTVIGTYVGFTSPSGYNDTVLTIMLVGGQ